MSSAAVATLSQPASPTGPPTRWIISRREDLTWFIGSALGGYLALALIWAGVPILPIQFIWYFALDNPHVVATTTRTYFDRAERRKLGWFLWVPIPLLALGPLAVWAGYADLFFVFAFCWQQLHVTKQHFGFMMLYKGKNGDRERVDFLLDRWFLLTSLFVPLAWFVIEIRGWAAAIPALAIAKAAVLSAYGAFAAVWIARQMQKWRAGSRVNWPKLVLLAGVIPLQWLALLFGARMGMAGALPAAIALGIFHSLQYHRLLWFHNANRYGDAAAHERNGLAAVLAKNVFRYLAIAWGLNIVINFLPLALFNSTMVQAAMWGIPFAHYCLDARIWHVREDRELAAALGMARGA